MNNEALSYVSRPFRPDRDLELLVELHNKIELSEDRPATLTTEQVKGSLDVPGLFRWVVDADGSTHELAGYGVLYQQMPARCYGDARVHPAWRRRGIGRVLIDALAEKTAELGSRYLAIDVNHDNQDAIRFLLTQGFRYRGDVWALLLPAGIELPRLELPNGYTVRHYAGQEDLPVMVELCNRAFGDLWGHWENVPGMVDAERMKEVLAEFDPEGIFIVVDANGEAVAQCRSQAAEGADSPYILDQPGVVPEHRAAGLHVPLALHAAYWLRSRGGGPVRLESWGDPAATIALYEALGFEIAGHKVSYVREFA